MYYFLQEAMPCVILFSTSNKTHVEWDIVQHQHPYFSNINLLSAAKDSTLQDSRTFASVDPITLSAPHAEIALLLMRCIQYNKHIEDTFSICVHHIRFCKVANAKELLLAILQHEELKARCLKVFKYELWCTQKVHPMFRRMVSYIGPYIKTHEDIVNLYAQKGTVKASRFIDVTNTKTSFSSSNMQNACQHMTVSSMYYTNPKEIPASYEALTQESDALFRSMRCRSPLWRSRLRKDDARDRFSMLQTQIQVLLLEYNQATHDYAQINPSLI
jgi:hypothetical protein